MISHAEQDLASGQCYISFDNLPERAVSLIQLIPQILGSLG